MHIALDASSLSNRKGGVQTYIQELIGALSRIDPDNRYTVCYRLSRFKRRNTWLVPNNPNWRRKLIQEPFNLLFPRTIDVFHGLGVRIPRYRHCALTVTLHDLFGIVHPHGSDAFVDMKRNRYQDIRERAAMIICDSESTRRDAETHLGIPSDRLCVAHLGVSAHFRKAAPASIAAVRDRYGLPSQFALMVGIVNRRKNQLTAIRALSRLNSRVADLHLVIAGRFSPDSSEILAAVECSPHSERIHFLKWVRGEDLPSLYSAASVFLFPSLYEGFGLPLLEAMACGTPVVASNTSSIPEVAGDAALLVDPKDEEALAEAITRVTTSRETQADMRAKGIEQASRFTWERTARATLDAYKKAFQNARNRRRGT